MKNNMFMALTTGLLNALALAFLPLVETPEGKQSVLAVSSLISPFLSIWLLKLYIRADDPPELTRAIAGLKACINICKDHLKDKSCSEEFKATTRAQLEEFQTALQKVRFTSTSSLEYSITPIHDSSPDS